MKEIMKVQIRPMNKLEILYETIFCSEYGAEHREELVEKHRDKLPELAEEHERSGMKINGKPIPFIIPCGASVQITKDIYSTAHYVTKTHTIQLV